LIDATVEAVAELVRRYPAHIRFIARERHGGVRPVREAIAAELSRFADEVAEAFAPQLTAEGWSREDVRMLAELYVDHMVMTATAFLEAQPGEPSGDQPGDPGAQPSDQSGDQPEAQPGAGAGDPEAVRRVAATARRQLLLISLGRRHWRTG
ncbi:TetR family transcriptional regulator, partial [Streptomyces sp. MCAF7]